MRNQVSYIYIPVQQQHHWSAQLWRNEKKNQIKSKKTKTTTTKSAYSKQQQQQNVKDDHTKTATEKKNK